MIRVKNYSMLFAMLGMLLLAACAQMGLTSPTSFTERMDASYRTVTQVRATARDLLLAKKLSAADAENIANLADNARTGLDIARGQSKTDQTAALKKLDAVSATLTALQTYLATHSVPP